MALTDYAKRQLDNVISNLVDTLAEEEYFTLKDVINMVNNEENLFFQVKSVASIRSSFDRITSRFNNEDDVFIFAEVGNYSPQHYSIKKDMIFFNVKDTGIHKEKNILHFDGSDKITYDFITKSFNVPVEKIYSHNKSSWRKVIFTDNTFMDALSKYEWLFNYVKTTDEIFRIIDTCSSDLYEKMPSGLINVINEQGELTAALLKEYGYKNKYGKYAKFFTSLCDRNVINSKMIDTFLKDHSAETLMKIIKNSILNGEFSELRYYITNFIEDYYNLKKLNYELQIDSNRDIYYNLEILKDIKNKEKNEILARQLRRLNFINHLVINDYEVVVPQNQEEKRDEGKQQNNCVGYYYDDSIIKGSNLIYFIRKSTNPKKSYITCRYNIERQDTVEARKVNNTDICNKNELELIKEISKRIKEGLGE